MTAPMVKFSYHKRGDNLVGMAEVPTNSGALKFGILIPLAEVREEVRNYLAAKPAAIAGESVGRLDPTRVVGRVATDRARRRLGTLIKAKMGGSIRPYEIAGPAGFARRIAQQAANKAYRRRASIAGDEVGISLKGIAKGIGKGAKAVAKGTGKAVKATAKGTVKVAKATGKGTVKAVSLTAKGVGKVADNPITAALLTAVPGGNTALAIVNAAKAGRQGPKQAIADITSLAGQGDMRARASADALEAAAQDSKKKDSGGAGAGVALAALGAVGVGILLLKK